MLAVEARSNPWPAMSFTAQHFRDRALDCRNLAKSARNEVDAAVLEEIAFEMEAEARRIDAEKVWKGENSQRNSAASQPL